MKGGDVNRPLRTSAVLACILLAAGCASLHGVRSPRSVESPELVARVLDDFHDAAAKADEARYFGHFAPEGVFLGTDATERWTVEEFRAYARPYFSQGRGWTYTVRTREVDVLPGDGSVAFFDEILWNEKWGVCRGSGVARIVEGEWKICQYNLSVPIPNDLLPEVAERIKAMPEK